MTRKDYVLIAAALNSCANGADKKTVAYQLADALAQDNPRFDRARFLKAAGVAS